MLFNRFLVPSKADVFCPFILTLDGTDNANAHNGKDIPRWSRDGGKGVGMVQKS